MKNIYNIYFALNRLVITASEVESATITIPLESIPKTAEELCRMLSIHSCVAIVTPSPELAFEMVISLFVSVTAAGGIVLNSQGESLMIYRNGRWDLPKGHWEHGETIEECALREVEEETGVGELTLRHKICNTTHIYNMKGKWEIKTTHWYLMSSTYNRTLIPQHEEGIERVKWCTADEVVEYLTGSFPTIQTVFAALSWLS